MSASTSDSVPGHLDDHRLRRHVDDPGLVHLHDGDQLAAGAVRGPDLHEGQLVLHRRLVGDVLDLEHVDEPVELLGRLLDEDVVGAQGDRHPADVGVVEVADGQRLDVEVAGPHEARDPVEHAGPVVDDRHEDVAALLAGAGERSRRRRGVGRRLGCVGAHSSAPPQVSMRSERPLPAGIIGKTFCSSAISNQTRAGPSTALAASIAGRTSSGVRNLPGGDAVGVGELQVVGPEHVRRVVVARVDDLLPLPDHPQLAGCRGGRSGPGSGPGPGSPAPGSSSGSRRRRRSPRSACRAGRGPRPSPPAARSPSSPGRPTRGGCGAAGSRRSAPSTSGSGRRRRPAWRRGP